MFKRILVAYDSSASAERALLYAEHVARLEGAEITVLHVYDPLDQYASVDGYELLNRAMQEVTTNLLREAVADMEAIGLTQLHTLTREGNSVEEILRVAEEIDAQLIVIGSRGLTQARDLLGSVSLHVLRNTQRPVLVIS